MLPARKGPAGKRDVAWFAAVSLLPLPWVVAQALGGLGIQPEAVAVLAGLAIVGGAFVLSWSMELAEHDIPQTLALLVLALVSVLPEYAVDLHFAIKAATDPQYAHYAVANMTGANRLLIGLGWAAVVLIACRRDRTHELHIERRRSVEIRYLLWATLYSFWIPVDGTLGLFDAAVLMTLFAGYVRAAMRGEVQEGELVGPPALFSTQFGDFGRRSWAILLFVYAGYAIFVSAEPFADGLVHVGRTYDVDEFLLVQWVAPLASESPEFVIAILFATRGRGSVGLGALVSSKVNQWTLLVGALPIAYCLASASPHGLPLDGRQTEELLLTSAQSLLATLLICDYTFSRVEAMGLAVLFGVQLVFPDPAVRAAFIVLYFALFVGLLAYSPRRRHAFLVLLGMRRDQLAGGSVEAEP
jgi:cation:H+ antiporter